MKLGRTQIAGQIGAYKVSEVIPDMHDVDSLNRVTITDDVTLLIENVTERMYL